MRPRGCALVLAAFVAAGVPARASAQEFAHPEEAGFSAAGLQRITETYQGYVDSGALPGAVLLIARGDRVVYFEAIGYRDREKKIPMTRDTIFQIASMTKPVTSVAAMMLAEEGKLDLDAPLAKYLPEFANVTVDVAPADPAATTMATEPARQPITVRDLLRHTAGLDYGPFAAAITARAYHDGSAAERELTLAELVDGLSRVSLKYQPGTMWEYSIAVEVVGRLVEIVSGMPIDRFIAARITRPLGMTATDFYVHPRDVPRLAAFQKDAAGQVPAVFDPTRKPHWLSAGGGLVSTAGDYLRFCQMLLDKGRRGGVRLLSPAAVWLMTEDALPPDIGYAPDTAELEDLAPEPKMDQGFGLGFAVRVAGKNNPLPGAVGTFQWYGAWGTSFWVDPKNDLIGILMIQVPTPQIGPYRRAFRTLAYQALLSGQQVAGQR